MKAAGFIAALSIAVVAGVCAGEGAMSPAHALTADEVLTYQGPDRQKVLEQGRGRKAPWSSIRA